MAHRPGPSSFEVLAEGRNPKVVPVSKAMSSGVVYCFEDDDIEEGVPISMAQRFNLLLRVNVLRIYVSLHEHAFLGMCPRQGSGRQRVYSDRHFLPRLSSWPNGTGNIPYGHNTVGSN